MDNFTDEHLSRTFGLAYYICPDKEIALQITSRALSLHEVRSAAQHKRFYYSLIGRRMASRVKVVARTKVSLENLQRLQWLVYVCAEAFEKQQEQPCSGFALTQKDFLIRFIKHLVQITMPRSSFYMTLGLSRILYAYTTHEAMGIYELILQNSERLKSEEYFRKQKAVLMQEMKRRFGNLLQTDHLRRGEERFKTQEASKQTIALAEECLNRFTLWGTSCVLPKRFDSMNTFATALQFRGNDPDDEHPVEIRRMHTLIHPPCFSRLVAALGGTPPEERLALPMFFYTTGSNTDSDDKGRNNPPILQEEDLAKLRNALADQAQRRKKASPDEIIILVDGAELSRLNVRQAQQYQFEIGPEARLLEVKGIDKTGEILLASCIIMHFELRRKNSVKEYSVFSEGGQQISFIISPLFDLEDEFAGAVVSFTYQDANLFPSLSIQCLYSWFSQQKAKVQYPVPITAGLGLLLLLAVFGTTFYFLKGSSAPQVAIQVSSNNDQRQANHSPDAQEARVPKPDESVSTTSKLQAETTPPKKNPSHSPLPQDKSSSGDTTSTEDTRGVHPELQRKDLALIKRIYVQSVQGNDRDQHIHDLLAQQLQNSKRFSLTERPDNADALLVWFVNDKKGDVQFDTRLISTTGKTLWTYTQHLPAPKYQERIVDVVKQGIQKLLDQIEAGETKR